MLSYAAPSAKVTQLCTIRRIEIVLQERLSTSADDIGPIGQTFLEK
jgi:hypothetical protein